MKEIGRFIKVLIILFGSVSGVSAFSLHCISVNTAGNVSLSWDKNSLNPADFYAYYIYHSTAETGPFTAVDSIFIFNDTDYTHTGALANNNPAYYYIEYISSGLNPNVITTTARAIYLNVSNPSTGFANLSWNATASPLIPGNSLYYKIYREYPAGFFTLLDSVNAATSPQPMTWSDQISICSDTIKYRIEVSDASGCKSVSNIAGEFFRDLQPPVQPVLDSVSLDINGNVIIGWNQSPSPDTREYVVLQGTATVDTSFGISNTVLYSTVQAVTNSLSFSAYSVDSCNNPSAPSVSHSTIFINAIFQLCEKSVRLSWNPYTYWTGQAEYEILVSLNGGPETIAAVVSSTFYEDLNLVSGSLYCYRVRARETPAGLRSSTSNRVCVVPVFPSPPSFSYIRSVNVRSESVIEVRAYVDASAEVAFYELHRSNTPAGPFSRVAGIPAGMSTDIFISDPSANTESFSYYYKIISIDSCNLPVFESQVSRSILLAGSAGSDYTNVVSWNEYSDWPTGVSRYNLYRYINGVSSPLPYRVLPGGGQFIFTDTVIDDFYSDGEFCYMIIAIEGVGNPGFFLDSSRSNIVCVQQEPSIFIPSAFRPGGGINDYFRPVNGYVDPESYQLDIFNRWGEIIFSTQNPNAGWDGSGKSSQAPEGVYVYRLRSMKPDGTEIEKVGAVTLIR